MPVLRLKDENGNVFDVPAAGKAMGIAGNESPVPALGYAFVLYETAPDTATITVEWD